MGNPKEPGSKGMLMLRLKAAQALDYFQKGFGYQVFHILLAIKAVTEVSVEPGKVIVIEFLKVGKLLWRPHQIILSNKAHKLAPLLLANRAAGFVFRPGAGPV